MDYYSLNRVTVVGRIGKNPEMRYTKNDKEVVNFSVATTEKYQNNKSTEWHQMVCFGKKAQFVNQYISKGDLVAVTGRLKTNKWKDKNGNNRYTTQIYISTINPLGNKQSNQQNNSNNNETAQDDEDEEDVPF